MFGYVRPLKDVLSEEEIAQYQAAYCGLCRVIGKRYGRVAQMFLNYDFTFLAMVLAKNHDRASVECHRCPVYPMRKRGMWTEDPGLTLAASESVVLCYWKLKDTLQDRSLGRKILARLATWALLPAYRKAKKDCPVFTETVIDCLARLRQMEQDNTASLDRPADAFAKILQASSGVDGEPGQAALHQMLYHLGRWIYLLDAWDDLEEDRKSGSYNPILSQFGGYAEDCEESIRETLSTSLGLMLSSRQWLEFGIWSPIIDNIITLGLPAMEDVVLSGQWRQRKKRIIRRTNHE